MENSIFQPTARGSQIQIVAGPRFFKVETNHRDEPYLKLVPEDQMDEVILTTDQDDIRWVFVVSNAYTKRFEFWEVDHRTAKKTITDYSNDHPTSWMDFQYVVQVKSIRLEIEKPAEDWIQDAWEATLDRDDWAECYENNQKYILPPVRRVQDVIRGASGMYYIH